jgi:putative nucleotidyltransferase with HDIG domain
MSGIKQFMLESESLPSVPDLVQQVDRIAKDPNSSCTDLQAVLQKDPSLSARLVQMANSPYYTRLKRVTSLRDAIVVVGMKTVRSVVTAHCTQNLYQPFDELERKLWEHSIGCAITARAIAKALCFPMIDEAYLAGLLHDVGRAIMAQRIRDHIIKIVRIAQERNVSTITVERHLLGFDHGMIGKMLSQKWFFPQEITEAIGCHHNPSDAKELKSLAVLIHLADCICHRMGWGPIYRPEMEVANTPGAAFFKLDKETISRIMDEAEAAFREEMGIFS